jgi:hypothetical protein
MPTRVKQLPIDPTWNLPVPWFVSWVDGKPCFPVADGQKWGRAVREKLCWVCGQPLQQGLMAFVIGPMCGINRASAEPPCDLMCAMYSAQACPFLTKPKMQRMPVDQSLGAVEPGGHMIARNPGCCAVWITKHYELIDTDSGPLIRVGEPQMVHWFAEGRRATRAEVIASIESGIPTLQAMAKEEGPEAELALVQATVALTRWLPNVSAIS